MGEDPFQELACKRTAALGLVFDGVADQRSTVTHLGLVDDEAAGDARHLPVRRHRGVGQARHVGEAACQRRSQLVLEPVLERVLGALGLGDGTW